MGLRWASLLLLLALASLAGASSPARAEHWVAPSAVTSVELDPNVLGDLGIRIVSLEETAARTEAGVPAFATVPPSELRFRAPGGDFERFDTGRLVHAGGFVLAFPDGARLSLEGFRLEVAALPDDFLWVAADGTPAFVLRDMQFAPSFDRRQLELRNLSVHLTPALAARLGWPALAGTWVGTVHVVLPALLPPASGAGAGAVCPETPGPIDVELTEIGNLSQVAREAGVRVALSPSATLENVGEGSVEWYQSIAPSENVGPHPYLSMAFYKLEPGGRVVQLGLSDVKHAFFAVNNDCPCAGGPILYAGCSDVYGVSTNANRAYLAPREEVDPFTGAWQRVGSHFDQCLALGTPPCNPATDDADDFRDHGGDSPVNLYHDAFEHRLVVPESELSVAGTRYFVEAWYVAAGDVDLANSMGRREVDASLEGSVWDFEFLGDLEPGSMLDELDGAESYVSEALGSNGRVGWASEATDLGDGRYRYRYTLMNFDYTPGFTAARVDLPDGATGEAFDFAGLGDRPETEWSVSVESDPVQVEWVAPPGLELDWGELVSFGFESDAPPGSGALLVTAVEAQVVTDVALPATVPVPEPGVPQLAAVALALTLVLRRTRRRVEGLGRRRGSSC